jgi:bacterioferritin (cytochrome b1)
MQRRQFLEGHMGFDLDADVAAEPQGDTPENSTEPSVFKQALSQNLLAERFAIDAYRKIVEHGENYDKATLRLVKVALAVEEEHAEILSAIIEDLRNHHGALAG